MKNVLILNGSLQGNGGNTAVLISHFVTALGSEVLVDYLELRHCEDILKEEDRFRKADGFVFATGTYWQSWSHYAQRFFEQATPWEGTGIWLGKPLCTLVSMHSVGGLEILSRIQTNFSLLGALIPPMCAIVHSYVNQLAAEAQEKGSEGDDIWGVQDIPVVAHNFLAALNGANHYRSWNVDRLDSAGSVWMK